MHSSLSETKRVFKTAIQAQLREQRANYAEKEAALPAYAHTNPLIDMLFWGRLRAADRIFRTKVADRHPVRVLDFGCGTGVMTHYLAACGHTVTGTDLTFEPLEKLKKRIAFPETCSFVSVDELNKTAPHSFECILALDVLEHVDSLDDTIETFRRLLTPDGVMIISGPTENILYRIGRMIAGAEFSGEYHVSTIGTIEERFRKDCRVLEHHTLYPLIPLFTVFSCCFDAPNAQLHGGGPTEAQS